MQPIPRSTKSASENFNDSVRLGKVSPYPIKTYRQLIEQVAQLSYRNKDNLLFYRGQTLDFHNKAGASSFYPSIYRDDNLPQREVAYKFELLESASRKLKELFTKQLIEGYKDVKEKRYIQWSILQHYNVCSTPLLDFTHSLRVACSFAQLDNLKEIGFVYVFGLPYLTNRISINSEHDIVNIRLLSICPPNALRPYYQEGYLAGTTDVTSDYDSKTELDFNNRLIAKFSIPNTVEFWRPGLRKIPKRILFPKNDLVAEICNSITTSLQSTFHPGDIGHFLTEWVQLENLLILNARKLEVRALSIRESIQSLEKAEILNSSQALLIDEIRKFRNTLVHEPKRIESVDLARYIGMMKGLLKDIHWGKNFTNTKAMS